MITKETHTVPLGIHQIRLSDYAQTAFSSIPSRKGITKAIKRGEIWLNGKPAQSGDWMRAGQILELKDLQARPPKTYTLPLEIIHEDDWIALINKPAGLEVSGNKFKTLENALSGNLTPSPRPDALPWPRPVHRLDYSTSGLLLVAKTAGAQVDLGQQFEARSVSKKYCAVVAGTPAPSGTVDKPINGMRATSRYTVEQAVQSLRNDHLSLLNLFPISGRTHQLRIHMASIGHPIVGDHKYGPPGQVLKGKGLFLAAIELRFIHPASRKKIIAEIDRPAKFESLLKREQARWSKFR